MKVYIVYEWTSQNSLTIAGTFWSMAKAQKFADLKYSNNNEYYIDVRSFVK